MSWRSLADFAKFFSTRNLHHHLRASLLSCRDGYSACCDTGTARLQNDDGTFSQISLHSTFLMILHYTVLDILP